MVFKSEACICASRRSYSGSAGKCEENISVKRIISQFFSPFLYYFEVVISQVWLDARPSNFDGRLSITPRFYPCKVTA